MLLDSAKLLLGLHHDEEFLFLASQDTPEGMLVTHPLSGLLETLLIWHWWVSIPSEDVTGVTLASEDTNDNDDHDDHDLQPTWEGEDITRFQIVFLTDKLTPSLLEEVLISCFLDNTEKWVLDILKENLKFPMMSVRRCHSLYHGWHAKVPVQWEFRLN